MAGVVCLFFCTAIKWLLRYDDSLDVFGIHCIGGIVGAHRHRPAGQPRVRRHRRRSTTSINPGTAKVAEYVRDVQLIAQAKAVGLTLVWSGVGSVIIFKIVDLAIGARVSARRKKQAGLDLTQHGERGYAYET